MNMKHNKQSPTHPHRSPAAVSALIGAAVGLGVVAAWAWRAPARAAARAALRKINQARDLHWLEKHPIAYG